MSKHNKTNAKLADLKTAPAVEETTNVVAPIEVTIPAPEPKELKLPSNEDKVFDAMELLVIDIAMEKIATRGDLKVVDLESKKYEALFATTQAQGFGFKVFGKVTNFPAVDETHTVISDGTMYKKMQKIKVPVGNGAIRYHGNLIRWFEGKDLTIQQLDDLMKTRPEPVKKDKVEPEVEPEV